MPLQDCQAKLALRDMEVLQLQQQLEASQRRGAASAGEGAALHLAAACEGESFCSLPDSLLRQQQSGRWGATDGSQSEQALEVLAQRRALEAAQAQNAQLQAALHTLAAEMQALQQAQLDACSTPPRQLPGPPQPLQDSTNLQQQDPGQAELRRCAQLVF